MFSKIPLVKNTISNEEIDLLSDWLKNYPKLTQGNLVKEFENKWSQYIGVKESVFVNSGSSALLLSYYVLSFMNLKNKNVIVPGLCWATDLAPLLQLGFNPILCDCNLEDLSLDLDHLENLIKKHNPSIVNLVSVLGLVPDMNKILELKEKYDFYLLEDVCESFGSKFENKNLGSFGDISVYSLYYGHHLSTIEGGMICTSNEQICDFLRMGRSHGWDRELSQEKQQNFRNKYGIDDFSASYTFYIPGFNLRATDLQAKIGIEQLKKADYVIKKRNENFIYLHQNSKLEWSPILKDNTFVSNFCFPVISFNKQNIVEKLINKNVETRPLICGSMGKQPFYSNIYGKINLKNCDFVDKYGLYVPNNPDLSKEELDIILDCLQ